MHGHIDRETFVVNWVANMDLFISQFVHPLGRGVMGNRWIGILRYMKIWCNIQAIIYQLLYIILSCVVEKLM